MLSRLRTSHEINYQQPQDQRWIQAGPATLVTHPGRGKPHDVDTTPLDLSAGPETGRTPRELLIFVEHAGEQCRGVGSCRGPQSSCFWGAIGERPSRRPLRIASSLTELGGANLEHGYALNYGQRRPTDLICTAVTGGFLISAGHAAMCTSLGVKGSQVKILSSRRRDRPVSPSETPLDLRPDLGKRLLQVITSGSPVDHA
jgi:hypothetical protein